MKRSLTAGEIALAQTMFQQAIDYSAVRLALAAGGKNTAKLRRWHRMARFIFRIMPIARIFLWRRRICKYGFMHEMTHVWQYQRGFSVLKSGVVLTCVGWLSPCACLSVFTGRLQSNQAVSLAQYGAASRGGSALFCRQTPAFQTVSKPIAFVRAVFAAFSCASYLVGFAPNHSRCG